MLAEIATVLGISDILRILKFPGMDDPDGKLELPRQSEAFLQLAARQARRIGNRREGFFAEDLVGHIGEENRIPTARVGDKAGTVGAQKRAQLLQFIRCHN